MPTMYSAYGRESRRSRRTRPSFRGRLWAHSSLIRDTSRQRDSKEKRIRLGGHTRMHLGLLRVGNRASRAHESGPMDPARYQSHRQRAFSSAAEHPRTPQ